MDPPTLSIEHPQNAVGVTKPLDMEISEQNESRVPASEQTGLRGDVAASAMFGQWPLQECSGDERRALSHSEKDASGTNGRPELFESEGKHANSEFNVTRPDDEEQHVVLSANNDNQEPRSPEQAVKAVQNGTQPSVTPGGDGISHSAAARDTSSIPGISMLANQSIPAAIYKHEEVVASKEVFTAALNHFHTVLGTRLTKKGRGGRERAAEVKTFEESIAGIPKLGGSDLDLHLLYVEVTSRGGLEQVIKDRKWKEVTNCFKFPETSASYILRKYYVGLLYYFEQAYLHGKTGPLIPPPISLPGPSPLGIRRSDSAGGIAFTPTEGQPGFKRTRKRRILPVQSMPAMDPASSVGLTVRSTIEGKFEHGYLVSVTVGTEKMRGVIYHVPPMQRAPQHATIPNYETILGAEPIPIREEPSLRGLKRKRRRADDMPKKDPNAPRPNRTGYNFFFAEQRARLKLLYPEKDRELSRMIGDAWNSLTEEEKTPYQDRGVQDKERYKIELRKYLELLKSQNGTIPTELAAEQEEVEDAKEAVVDAAIDVAVDVAVNNGVDVSVDDVVDDMTTKSVTTDGAAPHFTDDDDATQQHNYPIDDVEEGGHPDEDDDVDDGIPNTISEAPDGSVNLLATMDFDIEPQQPDSGLHMSLHPL
jgi:hypothetical protein